jgi:hypothetical protein
MTRRTNNEEIFRIFWFARVAIFYLLFEVWSYGIVEVATAVLGLENRDIHMHCNPKIYTCFCANPSLANQKQPI